MLQLFRRKAKNQNRLVIEGSEYKVPIKKGQTILDAAIAARINFPNMCNVGECGTCRCRVRKGEIKLKRDITRHIPIEEIKEGYVLACQSIVKSDVVVQVPGLSSTDHSTTMSEGTIKKVIKLTHDIFEVQLQLNEQVNYLAGQYAQLSVPGVSALAENPRCYSFAEPVDPSGTATPGFFIRHVPEGIFTDWLFSADRTGEKIHFNGPYGDFHYHKSDRPLLCVAGGSGLAPINALLQQLKKDSLSPPVTLLFGAREKQDLYRQEELKELANTWTENFTFLSILSDESENSDWQGLRGYINTHLKNVVPNLAEHDAYLCGPPVMLDAVICEINQQIPDERIYFDKFLDKSSI